MSAMQALRRLCLCSRCVHKRIACGRLASVVWDCSGGKHSVLRHYTTHKRSGRHSEDTIKISKTTESHGSLRQPSKCSSSAPLCKNSHQASNIVVADSPSVAAWCPTTQDYEALVVDLLLYRRESIESVLNALRKERALLNESIRKMEDRIADMHSMREEVREMLRGGIATQRETVAEALRIMGDDIECMTGAGSSSNPAEPCTGEDVEEVCL
ncbi:hypothetical protein TRVL_00938 [Trypanosoma vivax]|nr:hypothetical protein TRVL_00938 [Trypanosoma vivax]